MTKDEIFNKHSFSAIGAISPSKDFCLKAMDEYAKQQAISFSKYMFEVVHSGPPPPSHVSDDEFYSRFIEQQNKDNDK